MILQRSMKFGKNYLKAPWYPSRWSLQLSESQAKLKRKQTKTGNATILQEVKKLPMTASVRWFRTGADLKGTNSISFMKWFITLICLKDPTCHSIWHQLLYPNTAPRQQLGFEECLSAQQEQNTSSHDPCQICRYSKVSLGSVRLVPEMHCKKTLTHYDPKLWLETDI